ncbi:fasciclin domain-containing protein [Sphingomonas parva]|nr:fasciclin domain-containing protein [Sphingomonas parva]
MARGTILAAACLTLAGCGGNGDGGNKGTAADGNASAAAAPAEGKAETGKATLLDLVSGSRDLSTFANAVKAAGLTQTFSGSQPYTIFAPTDAAFQALSGGTANDLLAPDAKGQLTAVLTGHVVPGVVTAEDLRRAIDRGKGKAQLATVGGATLTFTREGDTIVAAGPNGRAKLVGDEQTGSNGVVHSLDAVLMP